MLTNGMIGHVFGPEPGRQHDSTTYVNSKLAQRIPQTFGRGYRIYGDSAYPIGPSLLKAWPGRQRKDTARHLWNTILNRHRTMVEHGFAKVTQLFPLAATRLHSAKTKVDIEMERPGKYF